MIAPVPKDSRLLIVGLVRNGEKTLQKSIQLLSKSCQEFKETYFFIVESDSADNTLLKLNLLCETTPHFRYKSLGKLQDTMPIRSQRMAHCRNAYLDEIQTNPEYQSIDYIAVADLDGVCDLLSASAISSCWAEAPEWDAVFANSKGRYYDIWALRHPLWCPEDCWYTEHQLKTIMSEQAAKNMAIYSKMVRIPSTSPWIEVDSAFGGFGIYRKSVLVEGRYSGIGPRGEDCCEHVPLHQALKQTGKKLWINPRLIASSEVKQHMPPFSLWPRV